MSELEPRTEGNGAEAVADPTGPLQAIDHDRLTGRVLVVDDTPFNRQLLRRLLDRIGHVTLEAADGQAALEVVKVERPDLVILDLTMPRLDGLRACQALRSDPELAGTRVLVLTGRDQPDDRAAARDAGADAYLVKPFSSLALLDAVKRLTDG